MNTAKQINHTKFVLNMSQKLDLRSPNKHVALQNLSIHYFWKNIKKQYKNNKLKILAPTWNDEFKYQMVLILCRIFKIILNIS